MHTTRTQQQSGGYSFIEVLVSVAILLIAIVGPLTIASKGLQNAYFARQQNTAFFLAQEGIEGVHDMQSQWALYNLQYDISTWQWTALWYTIPTECFGGSTACGIFLNEGTTNAITYPCSSITSDCLLYQYAPNTGRYPYRHYTGSGGTPSPYTRKLYFEQVSGQEAIRVRSVVSWHAGTFGATRSVELETYIYDFYKYELDI